MTRIYVAAASTDMDRAEPIMAALRDLGFAIALDWITPMRAAYAAGTFDADLPDIDRQRVCLGAYAGVRRADLLWLLAPNENRGSMAWCELACAQNVGIRNIASGAQRRRNVATALCERTFEHDSEALVWVAGLLRKAAAE